MFAREYGKNKWFYNDTKTDRWGDVKEREYKNYMQIVNGTFQSSGKYTTIEDVTILFVISEDYPQSIHCTICFSLVRPKFSGNQKISIQVKII